MKATGEQDRTVLQRIARRAMVERGLLPDFSAEAMSELGRIQPSATTDGGQVRDLRNLLWASIDNDDSRDLDQLTVAEALPGGRSRSSWPSPTWMRSSRGLGHRRARPPQHDLGLHGCRDLPDASRKAVHGHHVPGFQRGSAGDRRGNGCRRATVPCRLRYLQGVCPEPCKAGIR